jgi:cation-transporting P-type ATPase 13A2
MNPQQKTKLVTCLQEDLGAHVLFCGDGANDAGALRAAYTGVAIASSASEDEELMDETKMQDDSASLASSFTSHRSSISCVLDVLRQGRASSAASLAAFQFMILYSVCQFASVSMLYAYGIRVSDGQFLFADLLLVGPLALLFSRSDAARYLAETPPPKSICSLPVAVPTLKLAIVQIGFQIAASWLLPTAAHALVDGDLATQVPFATGMFVFVNLQYLTCAIVVNKGPPHRKPLYRNRGGIITALSLGAVCVALLALPSASSGRVGHWLELSSLDPHTRLYLLVLAGLNSAVSYAVVARSR